MISPALIDPGPTVKSGGGLLRVEEICGQSAVTACRATDPFKLFTPTPRGEWVWACSSSFGGGMVAGDLIELHLQLGPRARCLLTSQASTKVYRSPDSRECHQILRANLESQSRFILLPESVQSFANSSYSQRQIFHLDLSAGLIVVDWYSSGRVARGERWAFSCMHSRNEIFIDGRRVLLDSLRLESTESLSHATHGLGRFNCVGLVLIMGEPFRDAANILLGNISNAPIPRRGSVVCSASPHPHGVVVRIAGESVEAVKNELRRHLAFVESMIGENPWRGKA